MKPINLYSLYEIGSDLHALDRFSGDIPPGTLFFPLYQALEKIRLLLSGNVVGLSLAKPAAVRLEETMGTFFRQHFENDDGTFKLPEDNAPNIPRWQWSGITNALRVFENVFSAEMLAAPAYFASEHGGYKSDTLVNTAEVTLGEDMAAKLNARAKSDFQAAGKCLAFSLPTAAGFHACRAVEATLEDYYATFTGKTGTLNGWNDYLEALKKVLGDIAAIPKPSQRVVDILDHMRTYDRNPVAHPRAVLNDTEALVMFRAAANLITGMVLEIEAVRLASAGTGIAGPLTLLTGGAA